MEKIMNKRIKESKTDYFHNLAEGWDERVGNNSERAVKLKEVFKMIEISPENSVLDVGSGNGILLRFIHEKTDKTGKITAVDPAPGMIKKAKELHDDLDNIDYVTGFIEEISLPEKTFDVALCYAVIPHIDDIPSALTNINRMLKESGKLYIFHPASTDDLNHFHSNLDAPVKHDLLPGESEMKRLLSDAGFKINTYIDEPGLNFMECQK